MEMDFFNVEYLSDAAIYRISPNYYIWRNFFVKLNLFSEFGHKKMPLLPE